MRTSHLALTVLALLIPSSAQAKGPLRVHPANPRYFTDDSGKPIYLTGSHNWYNLQDAGRIGKPLSKKFDFDAYLNLLAQSNHNFIRLWAWEGAGYWWQGGVNDEYYEPLPYRRTGPGNALDGKPRFDLTQFDPAYFDRLRNRAAAARDRNIYVGVMLFQGWSIYSHDYGNPWPHHPFNAANNVNNIDGDADKDGAGKEVHSLKVPAVTKLQEAYIRKVIDTVNDLDNVLYEVTNETANHSRDWQYHVVHFVKEYERTKPRQHPVGMTYFDSGPRGTMDALLDSPADWISPGDDGGRFNFQSDPPVADPKKVSLCDTDHVFGVGGDADWVWKTFTRGHNPIYMDPLKDHQGFKVTQEQLQGARKAMGQTRRFADKVNLTAMMPSTDIASSKYCLADPAKEYLVYLPKGGAVTVDLSSAEGELAAEWFNPTNDQTIPAPNVPGQARRELKAPFDGPAVLHLKSQPAKKQAAGPLRVHPTNPRYFTDGTKSPDGSPAAVYLTGSHTWPNLIDRGTTDPPPKFDFDWYLNFLDEHDHNFVRLWSRHVTWYHDYGDKRILHAAPLAWPRTGPGNALDGKPRFDLSRFNEDYFDRLRNRVAAARDRGVYVGVMLFGGNYECTGGWRGNPFNSANNINNIDGDPNKDAKGLETQTMSTPAVLRLQEAYVRNVIDTVNDLDNVVYEISNESHISSKQWQYHLIQFIKDYEKSKPKQHPVGMTALWGDDPRQDNRAINASEADWVALQFNETEIAAGPPEADGKKVSLIDSDHWFIFPIIKDPAFARQWVWKAFLKGHNPILMEQLPIDSGSEVPVTLRDPGHVASRLAMKHIRRFASRSNFGAMSPHSRLTSTGYCLADPGKLYLVYQPKAGEKFSLELKAGVYELEWFDPNKGTATGSGRLEAVDGARSFEAPVRGEAVLFVTRVSR